MLALAAIEPLSQAIAEFEGSGPNHEKASASHSLHAINVAAPVLYALSRTNFELVRTIYGPNPFMPHLDPFLHETGDAAVLANIMQNPEKTGKKLLDWIRNSADSTRLNQSVMKSLSEENQNALPNSTLTFAVINHPNWMTNAFGLKNPIPDGQLGIFFNFRIYHPVNRDIIFRITELTDMIQDRDNPFLRSILIDYQTNTVPWAISVQSGQPLNVITDNGGIKLNLGIRDYPGQLSALLANLKQSTPPETDKFMLNFSASFTA
jgi:hypothetical protein